MRTRRETDGILASGTGRDDGRDGSRASAKPDEGMAARLKEASLPLIGKLFSSESDMSMREDIPGYF